MFNRLSVLFRILSKSTSFSGESSNDEVRILSIMLFLSIYFVSYGLPNDKLIDRASIRCSVLSLVFKYGEARSFRFFLRIDRRLFHGNILNWKGVLFKRSCTSRSKYQHTVLNMSLVCFEQEKCIILVVNLT